MANQEKLRSFRLAPRCKYGFEVPQNYDHAKKLYARNNNTKWQDYTALEMEQLDEYTAFINLGKDGKVPRDYKKIRVHRIFDINHDGRNKARCVSDGNLTEIPVGSV